MALAHAIHCLCLPLDVYERLRVEAGVERDGDAGGAHGLHALLVHVHDRHVVDLLHLDAAGVLGHAAEVGVAAEGGAGACKSNCQEWSCKELEMEDAVKSLSRRFCQPRVFFSPDDS